MNTVIRRLVLVVTLLASLQSPGWSALAPADPSEQRTEDLQKVQTALENKLVRERLAAMGYSPQEIDTRLNKLSDAELHKLAQNVDKMQPGGGVFISENAILIVLLVVLILVLI